MFAIKPVAVLVLEAVLLPQKRLTREDATSLRVYISWVRRELEFPDPTFK